MTRRLLLIAVLLSVVLAGCTAAPGAETDDPTTSTDDRQTEVEPDAVPGVADGGLTNATALARANEGTLADTGGEVRVSRGGDSEQNEYRLVAGTDYATYSLSGTRSAGDGGAVDVDLWSNETTRLVRSQQAEETSYRVAERRHDRLNLLETPEDYLAAGDFAVDENASANGTVVLTADAAASDLAERAPLAAASEFEGRLAVTEAGLIESLTVTAVVGDGTVTYSYETVRTGVDSVDRSDWVGDVPASATLDPELFVHVEDESALTVRNEGGDPVPANATLSLTDNETSGTATFETALESGETRYAAFDADGELTLTTEAPDGVGTQLTSPVSVTITTADGVDLHSASMGWASEHVAESDGEAAGGGSSTSSGDATGEATATASADG